MKDTIVLHHSDIPGPQRQADRIRKDHLQKFGQAGSYHYLIEPDSFIVQFRPEDSVGHHSGNWFTNIRSIGICLAGDFTKESPSHAQLQALESLLTDIQVRRGIPDSRIFLHREIKSTACPVIDLRLPIQKIRSDQRAKKIGKLQRAEETATGSRKNRLTKVLSRLLGGLN